MTLDLPSGLEARLLIAAELEGTAPEIFAVEALAGLVDAALARHVSGQDLEAAARKVLGEVLEQRLGPPT